MGRPTIYIEFKCLFINLNDAWAQFQQYPASCDLSLMNQAYRDYVRDFTGVDLFYTYANEPYWMDLITQKYNYLPMLDAVDIIHRLAELTNVSIIMETPKTDVQKLVMVKAAVALGDEHKVIVADLPIKVALDGVLVTDSVVWMQSYQYNGGGRSYLFNWNGKKSWLMRSITYNSPQCTYIKTIDEVLTYIRSIDP